MRIDVAFFQKMEVIDYSLLVGICDLANPNEGIKLLEIHDLQSLDPFEEKVDQVNSKEYGELLVDAQDRHDF